VHAVVVPHATPRRLTRGEYERIAAVGVFRGERVELIRGVVVRMSPIGPPHADVVDRLLALLIRRLGEGLRVRAQQPFLASDESEPEPDIAVVVDADYTARHPDRALLIVEVAESSLDYDRQTKGTLYAASGVAEYWVVDVAARAVEVRREPADGTWGRTHVVPLEGVLACESLSGLSVAVAELFPR